MDHQRSRSEPELIRVDFNPDKIRIIQKRNPRLEAEIGRILRKQCFPDEGLLELKEYKEESGWRLAIENRRKPVYQSSFRTGSF